MNGRIPFDGEPAIGTRMQYITQEYVLIGKTAFRKRDGTMGVMLSWETACPTCGDIFRTSSALHGGGPTRRCKAHRSGGTQVGPPGKRRKLSIRVIEPEGRP
jgi:hypothetical protein